MIMVLFVQACPGKLVAWVVGDLLVWRIFGGSPALGSEAFSEESYSTKQSHENLVKLTPGFAFLGAPRCYPMGRQTG
jgi:hypothetical protein